jgi:hypothetical protein
MMLIISILTLIGALRLGKRAAEAAINQTSGKGAAA